MQAAMSMIPKPIELTPPNIQQTRVRPDIQPGQGRHEPRAVNHAIPAGLATFPRDEARRIPANIAKLPAKLKRD
jgi:hypothetical protein